MSHVLAGENITGPRRRRPIRRPLLGYLALALGIGALMGVLWMVVVTPPGYVVQRDGSASTSERQLAGFFAGDAWFALLGAGAGLTLGWLAWARLKFLGWSVVLVAAGAAATAALVCWFVGYQLGPSEFNQRLASARPGDVVPLELTLRAKASLLVWPFVATVPVLLGSSLAPDDEEPRPSPRQALGPGPVFKRRSRRRQQT